MSDPWWNSTTSCREGLLGDFLEMGAVPEVIYQQTWDDFGDPGQEDRIATINALTGIKASAKLESPPWRSKPKSETVIALENHNGWAEKNILMMHSVLGVARGYTGPTHYHWFQDLMLLQIQAELPPVSIDAIWDTECTGPVTYYRYESHPYILEFNQLAQGKQELLLPIKKKYSCALGSLCLTPEQLRRFVEKGGKCVNCGKVQPWGTEVGFNSSFAGDRKDMSAWSHRAIKGEPNCPSLSSRHCVTATWNPVIFEGLMVEVPTALILERIINELL